ncbi:DUF4919 domain-containing protein [Brumicola blandensis]|uniref:DUF4919 domain-containing protein n=1 Tax=Brumicola blandensis TaxID=3075611 RepID=A0AAW8R3F6_9ALTE|nr:DUF4919 domain-containing protein [Alteromonas sp. W409]MDT0583826.1 DUF4919 domain-containing protein [Alteromonas sp. W409]
MHRRTFSPRHLFSLCFIVCFSIFVSACGSTPSTKGTAQTSNQAQSKVDAEKAALAKQQQEAAKKQILNYAKADADYRALVAKFRSGQASNGDYDAITRVYPLTSNYNPYASAEQTQKLVAFEHMESKQWDACLRATDIILNENFTSLTGHYGAMVCHYEQGQQAQGEFHNQLLDGFIDAVWRSGDGRSPATAFYITSSNDLYAFVQMHGFIVTGQSLVYHQERPMDAISVENPETGEEATWYFDVTAQFRRGILDDLEAR